MFTENITIFMQPVKLTREMRFLAVAVFSKKSPMDNTRKGFDWWLNQITFFYKRFYLHRTSHFSLAIIIARTFGPIKQLDP